ncbi:MAG: NAD(P)H-hydrate epimerase, partial [Thermoplasmata archaeon]|nr:NAD(P)H-hydrate epimerase [Thermoplasmata archaeon]
MITPMEMRVLDRNALHAGISTLDLMEAAGKAVADVARSEFSVAGKRVLVVCGTGNNGGDGLVAARHLAKEGRVTVLLARPPDQFATEEARTNFGRLRDVELLAGLDRSEEAMEEADLVIDALLGIGTEGSLREPFATLVRQINASRKPVLSVDVPSGFGTDVCVRPTATVALHDVKEGMTPENSGRIRVADIGIPPKVATMIGPGEFLLYPVPKSTSHKGQNGRLLVIAGGPYTGAPALVGFGALVVAVDLVHIATPALAATDVASYSPTLIVHPLV